MASSEKSDHPKSSVIAAGQVKLASEPQRIGLPQSPDAGKTDIHVIRDGDTIVGVEVQCSCGQRHRLRFEY